ncbi:conserved hypothetical protein [Uncinocarpus reesii 1704]|uniref:Uncharacterized protein n=1 Tax=Uncinocarpus reesii (strain UAMH 1704) TaxID=336963 RepID=C4JR33_UNCRE|nr:uncharacterized protein UREG_03515 [Uncinocarpus reesii 1704]EEP78669.1 conserved hypothetical protein [Uncinocarpus reesii 1704]
MARSQSSSPSILTSFIRWLRLKNYQYEVTFALYMLTPMEKFIFNSLLLLVVSMFLAAAYIYLPNHIITAIRSPERSCPKFMADSNLSLMSNAEKLGQQNVIMETASIIAEATGKRLGEL